MSKFLFNEFKEQLKAIMPEHINEILSAQPQNKIYAIAFVTTDDFYGMYTAYETKEKLLSLGGAEEINAHQWSANEWSYSMNGPRDIFYDCLVNIAESDHQINLMVPSDEKWGYAVSFLDVVCEAIQSVPQQVFKDNGYSKEEIVFFVTMSDGDYMDEMIIESAKKCNAPATIQELLTFYQ